MRVVWTQSRHNRNTTRGAPRRTASVSLSVRLSERQLRRDGTAGGNRARVRRGRGPIFLQLLPRTFFNVSGGLCGLFLPVSLQLY